MLYCKSVTSKVLSNETIITIANFSCHKRFKFSAGHGLYSKIEELSLLEYQGGLSLRGVGPTNFAAQYTHAPNANRGGNASRVRVVGVGVRLFICEYAQTRSQGSSHLL